GYDPVFQTISDLAANESPVKWVMSSFFILGGTLSLIGAVYARALALPGRIALFVSGLCTYGLTIFPTPLVGHSDMHRVFAISSFVLSAGWPILAMRRDKSAPFIIRPLASIVGTAAQALLALWFLMVWSDPATTNIGVWERIVATSQSLYVSIVVLTIYRAQQKAPESL
ncbi:MAG: hypothetical protein RL410_834, partial [Actinomycetota bacterium]